MSKTLDEQFRDYYLREGFNDGREQGSVETRIEDVCAIMSSFNIDAEAAMDALHVPEDIREEVRKSL